MNWKRGLGIALIFVGIFLATTGKVITGAVIGTSLSNSFSLIALAFFVVGIVLTTYREKSHRESVEDIVRRYKSGAIDVIQTVAELNKVTPIQNIRYRTGKQHTLVGERDAYPIDLKKGRKAEELAITEYLLAAKNNSRGIRQSNIEIKRGLSTKHYTKAFKDVLEKFKIEHARELEKILRIA